MRVRLRGGPEHSATWVAIALDGSLVIELYDHSAEARNALGNDVAYTLTVASRYKGAMLRRLLTGQSMFLEAEDKDDLLIHLIAERFVSYFDVQHWLQARRIPYTKAFDGQA